MIGPLDAAKAIAGREPLGAYGEVSFCLYCQAIRISPYDFHPVTEHLPDCPWLALPQVVAALEAADVVGGSVLLSAHDPLDEIPDAHALVCSACGEEVDCDCTAEEFDNLDTWEIAMRRNYRRIEHDEGCVARELMTALKVEPA